MAVDRGRRVRERDRHVADVDLDLGRAHDLDVRRREHGDGAAGEGLGDEASPVRARSAARDEEIARLDPARVVVHARDPSAHGADRREPRAGDLVHQLVHALRERRRRVPHKCALAPDPRARHRRCLGSHACHVEGSKTSFTVAPLGSTAPAAGS